MLLLNSIERPGLEVFLNVFIIQKGDWKEKMTENRKQNENKMIAKREEEN